MAVTGLTGGYTTGGPEQGSDRVPARDIHGWVVKAGGSTTRILRLDEPVILLRGQGTSYAGAPATTLSVQVGTPDDPDAFGARDGVSSPAFLWSGSVSLSKTVVHVPEVLVTVEADEDYHFFIEFLRLLPQP